MIKVLMLTTNSSLMDIFFPAKNKITDLIDTMKNITNRYTPYKHKNKSKNGSPIKYKIPLPNVFKKVIIR